MNRFFTTLFISGISPLLFWASGFNFDHRGPELMMCIGLAILLALYTWFAPMWDDEY